MRALLLTTCDFQSSRIDAFERLTESLVQTAQNSQHELVHIVLMQRAQLEALSPYRNRNLGFQQIILQTPNRMSISAARNAMLRVAHERNLLQSADWVAFPDDDAWYPAGLVDKISEVFLQDPPVDVITCQYSNHPFDSTAATTFQRRTDLFRMVTVFSSNTIFVRQHAVVSAGIFFDERLGLGAPINGGEDLDFALRAAVSGRAIAYCAEPLVGHRDRLFWVRSRYYQGSLCALARSAACTPLFRLAVYRKLLVGTTLVLKGELPVTQFLRSIRLALGFYTLPDPVNADCGVLEHVSDLDTGLLVQKAA